MATATGVVEIPAYISDDEMDINAHPHPLLDQSYIYYYMHSTDRRRHTIVLVS
jgi:hypothetical protein